MNDPKNIELSLVLPAYKEKENLAVLVPQIETEFQDVPIEIIIVDDHSEDGSRELIHELNERYENIIFLERPGLLGIGSALRDGYQKAQGNYILSSDADLSFNVKDMRALYEKIRIGFDIVLGYKVVSAEVESERDRIKTKTWRFSTFIASPMSNLIIGVVSGLNLKNYNTNFRILKTSVWKGLTTIEDGHFFLFETIIRANRRGAKITEIPVAFYPRKFGESKVSFFKQAPKYFFKLIRSRFSRN